MMSVNFIEYKQDQGIAHVIINNPARMNSMTRKMWGELEVIFNQIQIDKQVKCVIVRGVGQHFCAGGDISEYAQFRFNSETLENFHEKTVWNGLKAMLSCDVPILAQIQGNCMGAGVEIACCCDIRLCSDNSLFGAPIAKLGFPMAPKEAELVVRELGLPVARQLLLEACVFSAHQMHALGFVSEVTGVDDLSVSVAQRSGKISSLSIEAARLNKQTLRSLVQGYKSSAQLSEDVTQHPYAYASNAHHREGVMAFLEKRRPQF